MKSFATHMTVSFVTILFCVLYLYLGNSFSEDLRLSILQKNKNVVFQLCNPTWGYIAFEDNLFFWDILGSNSFDVKVVYKTEEGNKKTIIDPVYSGLGTGEYRLTLSKPNIILPKICMRKTYPLGFLYNEDFSVSRFKVIVNFRGMPNYKDNKPYTVIESEWFETLP